MASVRAGDIRQLTIDGKEYDVKAEDANVNIRLSGFVNEKSVNGNGTTHTTQRRKLAGFSGCPISIDDTRGDLEALQAVSDEGGEVPVTMTLASGITYGGALGVVGDLEKATGDGTLELEMRGAKFEQI